jgi:hypothetical protein
MIEEMNEQMCETSIFWWRKVFAPDDIDAFFDELWFEHTNRIWSPNRFAPFVNSPTFAYLYKANCHARQNGWHRHIASRGRRTSTSAGKKAKRIKQIQIETWAQHMQFFLCNFLLQSCQTSARLYSFSVGTLRLHVLQSLDAFCAQALLVLLITFPMTGPNRSTSVRIPWNSVLIRFCILHCFVYCF